MLSEDIIMSILFENVSTVNYSKVSMHCLAAVGIFPEANKDPVIQIANMVIRQGETEPFIKNVFTLKSCAPVVGSQVLSYETETELLQVCCSLGAEFSLKQFIISGSHTYEGNSVAFINLNRNC